MPNRKSAGLPHSENIPCFMYFRRVNYTANTSSHSFLSSTMCCLMGFTSKSAWTEGHNQNL
jgi:hypothetical protein